MTLFKVTPRFAATRSRASPSKSTRRDHFGILGLDRREQLVEAVADRLIQLGVGHEGEILEIVRAHDHLLLSPLDGAPLMIGNGRGEDPAQPAPNHPYVTQLSRSLDRLEHKRLQDLLGLFGIAQSPLQKTEKLTLAFHQRPLHCRVTGFSNHGRIAN